MIFDEAFYAELGALTPADKARHQGMFDLMWNHYTADDPSACVSVGWVGPPAPAPGGALGLFIVEGKYLPEHRSMGWDDLHAAGVLRDIRSYDIPLLDALERAYNCAYWHGVTVFKTVMNGVAIDFQLESPEQESEA